MKCRWVFFSASVRQWMVFLGFALGIFSSAFQAQLFAQNGSGSSAPVTVPFQQQVEKEAFGQQKADDLHRWSFGLNWVVYHSGTVWRRLETQYFCPRPILEGSGSQRLEIGNTPDTRSFMQGRISFGILPNTRLLLSMAYFSDRQRERYESHQRFDDPNISDYDTGELVHVEYSILDVNFMVRYHLKRMRQQAVRPFFQLGIGKQKAWVNDVQQLLFQEPDPGTKQEDNRNEFLKDLNSPFYYLVGIGTEYFFNSSVAVQAAASLERRKSEGTHRYRFVDSEQGRQDTLLQQFTLIQMRTYFSLGLNFYF